MGLLLRSSSLANSGNTITIQGTALTYDQADGNFVYLLTNMSGSNINITGSTGIVGTTTINYSTNDTANSNGANSHILLKNTNSTGQTSISSIIDGRLAGKLRNTFSGSWNYVASGSTSYHAFYIGGDAGTGTASLIITGSKVGIGTLNPTNALEIVGNVSASWYTGSLLGTASLASTASYVTGSIFTSANLVLSASYALTASTSDNFTVRGNLIVSGNTTIGDATTDIITLNAATMSLGSGTGILNIDSNTLYVDGNNNRVGIGTSTPTGSLDVKGQVTLHADASNDTTLTLYTYQNVPWTISSPSTLANRLAVYAPTAGGTTVKLVELANYTDGTVPTLAFAGGNTGAGYPHYWGINTDINKSYSSSFAVKQFSNNLYTLGIADSNDKIVAGIKSTGDAYFSGSVGIGTSTPSALLEIKLPSPNPLPAIIITGSSSNGYIRVDTSGSGGGVGNLLYVNDSTSNPSTNFFYLKANSNNYRGYQMVYSEGGALYGTLGAPFTGLAIYGGSSTEVARFNTTGLGIGTTNPSASLHVSGAARIDDVLTLPYQNPLPSGKPTGSIALSGSGATFTGMFMYNGTSWIKISA